jgi:L-ascorbate metabolism protein UlaG (beta-lactamase superfamily)
MAKLTVQGYATFSFHTDRGTNLVIDQFFADDPSFKGSAENIEADFILLNHGHYGHADDVLPLARR